MTPDWRKYESARRPRGCICSADGCSARLHRSNRSGLCAEHHRAKRLKTDRDASREHAQRERERLANRGRFTVSGLVRGCHTSVTADTAEDARRLLEAMQ